ncbi:hephaestin-like 1 [Apophysomyces ossiformis]|uniref:Hephaestin-like 1 n=1 Tax=Apophysomyces ossiformis TaxID=679940 RepID=A0A8H7BVR2_9FUNG|nr:hephaestin-like 1 [Apophysomyces ossiformis]
MRLFVFVNVVLAFAIQHVTSLPVDPDQDDPVPYVAPPVNYTAYFGPLHEELEKSLNGQTRVYYIAAEELTWDYNPNHKDTIHDLSVTESPARTKLVSSPSSIGSKYIKALYREYTDDTFTTLKSVPSWQGNMGPILRAEVGDTLEVHFWNKASHNYTIHPHGVHYEFEHEGAVYKGSAGNAIIPPGGKHTYIWTIRPRAGPGPKDGDSLVWGYHSHVHDTDLYDGLYGAIIIYRAGLLNQSRIDREIVSTVFCKLAFKGETGYSPEIPSVFNENHSQYLERTMAELAPQLDKQAIRQDKSSKEAFHFSNVKNSINGVMYGDFRDLAFPINQTITWHLLGWGDFLDINYVSWQNAEVTLFGKRVNHVRLLPATFQTVHVRPMKIGKQKFGFLDNQSGALGMSMVYRVTR